MSENVVVRSVYRDGLLFFLPPPLPPPPVLLLVSSQLRKISVSRAPTRRHYQLNCDERAREKKRRKETGLITKWNSKVQRRTRPALIVFIQLRGALRRPRTSFHYFKSDVVLLPATYRTSRPSLSLSPSISDRLYRCHFSVPFNPGNAKQ